MIRAVIDTNCLLLSIPPKNQEYWLYESFRKRHFEWILSNEIISEYAEQTSMFYSPSTSNLVLEVLLSAVNVGFVEPYFRWQLVEEDEDDNKFVDVTIASGADYLVTQDKHIHKLKSIPFPRLQIVKIDEFREIIKKSLE